MNRTISQNLLLNALQKLVRQGSLTISTASGESVTLGDGGTPKATMRFTDHGAERALLLDPEFKLGELFMDDRIVIDDGSIYDVLALILRDADNVPPSLSERMVDSFRYAIRRVLQYNLPGRSKSNVARHYDLGNRLYDLFLDQDRQYSCAYFEHPGQTLEEAQLAKKRHIAAKLLVEPGNRILDIGCGWGGMVRYLASVTDAERITGITLSEEQLAAANGMLDKPELAEKISFRLEDYRTTEGPFERIVSVGMFEHVGVGFFDIFFRKCRDLLTEDGVMLLHFIGKCDVPDFNHPWLEKYIFPGGHLPSLSEVTPAIERAGLFVTDLEVLRLHYVRTLQIWRERFMARRDAAKALYDERFCKMWEFYLSMAEAAFRFENVAVFQIQLARRQDKVPLTRDYLSRQKEALRQREASPGL